MTTDRRMHGSPASVTAALDSVGPRFRQERLAQGLRLSDAAVMSGLSETYISRIESGDRVPSLPAFLTLATVYGRDPTSFVRDVDPGVRVTAHQAGATWDGSEAHGAGVMVLGERRVPFDRTSRLTASVDRPLDGVDGSGSPEELVALAFSGCFAMSLAHALGEAGYEPRHIETAAEVHLEDTGETISISGIEALCRAVVPRIEDARFQEIVTQTERSCVVARALAAVPINLDAQLVRRRPRLPSG